MKRSSGSGTGVRNIATLVVALFSSWVVAGGNCGRTSVGLTPIMDLGTGQYQGTEGGLYPGGGNVPPPTHLQAGLQQAAQIQPLDQQDSPSASGSIVMVSVGMSNTTMEFSRFVSNIGSNKNSRLRIVDCALGGNDVTRWLNPPNTAWNTAHERLASAGVNAQQVQVVWIKQALAGPNGTFTTYLQGQQARFEILARVVKGQFPNALLIFYSSRIYAGYANNTLNPEPYAYQDGFAIKAMIENQMGGEPELNFDPANGEVKAAWLGWGPYLWADGVNARSDGLVWVCDDLANDGTHPSNSGEAKVAGMLEDFFRNDTLTKSWFNAGGVHVGREFGIAPQAPRYSAGADGFLASGVVAYDMVGRAFLPDVTGLRGRTAYSTNGIHVLVARQHGTLVVGTRALVR